MKKFLGNIKKKSGSPERNGSLTQVLPEGDAPEAVVVREVTAFCESGAPNSEAPGEEYLHLPAIVDAAESSPIAAKEAAMTIRRYLSKEHYQRGFAQYNAVMLMRILTDNPAHVFTQNFDAKFVSTVKELLRDGRDTSVQQILRETLDYFEAEKAPGNDTLGPLVEMWRKEKGRRNTIRYSVGWGSLEAVSSDHHTEHQQQHRGPPGFAGQYQQQPSRRRDVLPPPEELASRIEEAKTTARLLVQTVQSTTQAELLANDLVQEFADRARTTQRSIQSFMNCQNPTPDPDTMLTLIETNDQLNIAMSKHQRAVLQARKSTSSPQPPTESTQSPISVPQHNLGQNVYASAGQTDHGSFSASPPRRQYTLPSPISPLRREEQFSPPPGPPPAARGAVRNQSPTTNYEYSNAYSAPEQPPPVPTRVRPQSQAYASTAAYGVAENPFSDDEYGDGSEQPKRSNPLFDRSENTPSPRPQQVAGNQYASELSAEHHAPASYNTNYQSSQTYPSQTAPHQSNVGYGSYPVSPIDDTQEVGRRVNDLHI
ncbi:uncharacterized protein Z518_01886 [Rhinocladiella mackenziei CBS 650.93]|uniref:GAT domain-containing protein n=1 Tax=Rhinocladiella mackenziei CBS 650.93 TaxID=1442369 RepID=A0A0D2H9R6_9EURO|nr:uncharacterized protein Z518_01886 [Rhinocladiella mackenziei CBS 650.93]KIX07233.1 hypothetical protein Z518_01886 [Rhinocladiella mackenziei CBS 650.93]